MMDLSAAILRLYGTGLSSRLVAKELGIKPHRVYLVIKAHGVSRERAAAAYVEVSKPRYEMTRGAFRQLSPDTAWVLGVIASDGSVNPAPYRRVNITSKDLDLLANVRRILKAQHPVGPPRRDGVCVFSFGGQEILADLAVHGIGPRKARTLRWPWHLPSDLIPHFARGAFDGDGSFHLDKRNRHGQLRSSLSSSSIDFLSGFLDVARDLAGVVGGCLVPPGEDAGQVCLCHRDSVRLARWFYAGSSPDNRLQRKFERAAPFL